MTYIWRHTIVAFVGITLASCGSKTCDNSSDNAKSVPSVAVVAPKVSTAAVMKAPNDSAACSGETQSEMSDCAAKEYQRADEVLTRVWKSIHHSQKLLDAQRKWIAFKESDCDAVGEDYEGGSMQGMVIAQCLTKHTLARVDDLKEIARFQDVQ